MNRTNDLVLIHSRLSSRRFEQKESLIFVFLLKIFIQKVFIRSRYRRYRNNYRIVGCYNLEKRGELKAAKFEKKKMEDNLEKDRKDRGNLKEEFRRGKV